MLSLDLFSFTFLLKAGVVLTLAGIAGLIISFGMAVDANVLIFERIKDELKEGKTLNNAIDAGFDRAWSAIRDSNFSSLITCAILFSFGSSIIRGFAFNLAAGILVFHVYSNYNNQNPFAGFASTKMSENLKLLGVRENTKVLSFDFIGKVKFGLVYQERLLYAAILAIFVFGLNLGNRFQKEVHYWHLNLTNK